MSAPPTRCCAPATSGRCSNAPAPYGQSRYIGVVEIAACNHPKHQAALRSLPDFRRRAGVCGADDCGKAAESGLCPEHRQLYRRHGINIRALLAQEAPMTEPITPALADDGEPSEGDLMDAPLFVGGTDAAPAELVARWGHKHTAPVQPMSADLDGLAAIAARGQQPTAPGPTVAELQQQLAAMTAERDRLRGELKAALDRAVSAEAEIAAINSLVDPEDAPAAEAVSQRQRAEAVEAELFAVDRALHTLGAYGNGPTIDRLLQVLTPEDRRNILELQAAEARMDLARLRARRLNPAPPEKLAEYAAKVAALNARIAALDAG